MGSRHSRRMRNPKFYVYSKKPMAADDSATQGAMALADIQLIIAHGPRKD